MIGPEKEEPMEVSVMLKGRWLTIKKPLNIIKSL